MAQASTHKRGYHALVMLFLILTPISASRSLAVENHIQNRTRLHFNQTSSAATLSLCLAVQGVISASYSVYSTYKSYKAYEDEKGKIIQAKDLVGLYKTTHTVLCGAVDDYVRSLLSGAQTFQSIAQHPNCDQAEKSFLVTYLAEVRGQPLGNKEEIREAVDRICRDGFTKSDAMALKLEETWWMGVAQGLGCQSGPVDDKFLTDVWSGSSAMQSSSLLQRKSGVDVIGIGLMFVSMNTDAFSIFGTFTPEGSSAKVYEDFTINSIQSLNRLSCRLSHPMYLRSLRAEVLEKATLAFEFNHAGLTLPQQNVDVCKDIPEECDFHMVCHQSKKCLIQIVDLFDKSHSVCGRNSFPSVEEQSKCFTIWTMDEDRTKAISDSHAGSVCQKNPSQFYKICGPSGQGIVHQSCIKWGDSEWVPDRVNGYQRMKPVAKYDSLCQTPFDRLKEASELIQNLEEKKTECGWPGI